MFLVCLDAHPICLTVFYLLFAWSEYIIIAIHPIFLECAAGYYRNGDDCEMCTGLSIKMDAGDDTNCSTECTGISDIPNANHTACSKLC